MKKGHFLILLAACFLALPFESTAQQLASAPVPKASHANAWQRFYVGADFGGGLLPRSNVDDSDNRTKTSITGLGSSECGGVLLPKGFSVEACRSAGEVRGQVVLISAVPQFKQSLVAQDPQLASFVSAIQIPDPRADLKIETRSIPIFADWRTHIGSIPIMVGGGWARSEYRHTTIAKSGIPADLTFDEGGNPRVQTQPLFDSGRESHNTGGVRIGFPLTLRNGVQFIPRIMYFEGKAQFRTGLYIFPGGLRRKLSY